MFWVLLILLTFAALAAAFYRSITKNFGYFQKRGVVEVPTCFPWGSEQHKKMVNRKVSFITSSFDLYNQYKNEKMVVHFGFGTPYLLINDLEIAKAVMIKDFDYFTDRRVLDLNTENKVNKITLNMPTALKGEKWKLMRNIMSPVFTSGKLKAMVPILLKANEELNNQLHKLSERNEEFEAKELFTDWTLDIIASCGFGVKADAFNHEGNKFRDMVHVFAGQKSKGGTMSLFKVLFILSFPKVAKLFKLAFFDEEAIFFLEDIIKRTIKSRRENPSQRRGDLIDLALEAIKDKSELKEVEKDQFEKDAVVKPNVAIMKTISDEEMEDLVIANAMQIFHGGYETTSTIMGVIAYFLAKNQDVQDQIVDEIQTLNNADDMDYYSVQKLVYLDQVVNEATRHYPLTVVERRCVKDYKVSGSDFVIPENMVVQIPTLAIMMDEKYFPEPEKFNPQHFSPENKSKRSPYAFLAFGQGPRNCIGMRFALLQIKLALVQTLSKYRFITCSKTVDKLVPDPLSRSGQPVGGFWIKVEQRK